MINFNRHKVASVEGFLLSIGNTYNFIERGFLSVYYFSSIHILYVIQVREKQSIIILLILTTKKQRIKIQHFLLEQVKVLKYLNLKKTYYRPLLILPLETRIVIFFLIQLIICLREI